MARGQIVYGTRLLNATAIDERVARTIQSEAARALADSLSLAAAAIARTSRSHSRSLVAAAAASANVSALGLDVEWTAPGRPFATIMRSFVPSLTAGIDRETFYRGWTFLEAHFKAFQCWPAPADIEEVLDRGVCGGPWRTTAGIQLLQHSVAGSFQLTLVWKCPDICTVDRAPENQA